MRLIWSPRSRLDRQHVFQSIAFDNFDAAVRLDANFNSAANGLLTFPQKGRQGRRPGTRELVAHPNYVIVYRVSSDEIEIVRILHAAQRWP